MSLDLSPLASANPLSIDQIFEADPQTLTDVEFAALITELRRRRSAFAAEEAAKQAKGKAAKEPKAPKPSASTAAKLDKPAGELSLDDLLS